MGGDTGRSAKFWQVFSVLACAACICSGCGNHPSDEQIRQQAAQTTQQVKENAEKAAANARVVAAEAERKLNAVASGVKQGLQGSGPDGPAVDINSAGADQLETLPGITPAKAQRIINGRPYSASHDLVARHILTSSQYDRISSRIAAR